MSIEVLIYQDVADGPTPGQFAIKTRTALPELAQLPREARLLLASPVVATMAVNGADPWPHLSPVWFEWKDNAILVNIAKSRKKHHWLKKKPQCTLMLMNPEDPYQWMSLMATVTAFQHETASAKEGQAIRDQLDHLWRRYTESDGEYALRSPEGDEERVLLRLKVDKVVLFGLGDSP